MPALEGIIQAGIDGCNGFHGGKSYRPAPILAIALRIDGTEIHRCVDAQAKAHAMFDTVTVTKS